MKAQIGDFIRTSSGNISRVVKVHLNFGPFEEYETENSELTCEEELEIDDVFLESEVEVG